MKSLYTDSTTGKPCNAKLWFSIVSAVITFKFALANMTVGTFEFGTFDAAGASMLIAAFGGVYGWRSQAKKGSENV
jgi:hypothetical protein